MNDRQEEQRMEQKQFPPAAPTDTERLDWLERLAATNALSLELNGHYGRYEVWLEKECLAQGRTLREAIDHAREVGE